MKGNSQLQRKEAVTAANDYLREIANEPSLGLYFVQEHVSGSVPALMEIKGKFKDATKETKMEIHSLNNSIYSTKHFSQVVPAQRTALLQEIRARPALASSLSPMGRPSDGPPSLRGGLRVKSIIIVVKN